MGTCIKSTWVDLLWMAGKSPLSLTNQGEAQVQIGGGMAACSHNGDCKEFKGYGQ